jgi:hypothetical protein
LSVNEFRWNPLWTADTTARSSADTVACAVLSAVTVGWNPLRTADTTAKSARDCGHCSVRCLSAVTVGWNPLETADTTGESAAGRGHCSVRCPQRSDCCPSTSFAGIRCGQRTLQQDPQRPAGTVACAILSAVTLVGQRRPLRRADTTTYARSIRMISPAYGQSST